MKIFMKPILLSMAVLALFPGVVLAAEADKPSAAAKPNFVIILADDQGWGDLSIHGNKNLSTPHIDSLARDGALFEHFFVCPLCAPTRAEFLTGRYHGRGGVRGVTVGQERLNLDEKTIAEHFKAAGYATGIFGKWHNGSQYPYHPNGRGFDEFYGYTSGHWGQYFDPPLEHNGELVRGKGYINDDLTDHALAFIEQHHTGQFFCYLPLATPHSPFMTPDKYWDKFKAAPIEMRATPAAKEDLDKTRCVLAMCENIDWNVGRVLARLDDLKLAKNTIVVYFSDNGPNTVRWNGGMKGIKGSTDEGGVRVPFLIRWPDHIPSGSKMSRISGAIDLLPTFAAMANVPIAGGKPLDGENILPYLLGTAKESPDRTIFSQQNNKVSARTQQYRLDADGALYDMQADPSQKQNIASVKTEIAEKLSRAVATFKRDVIPKEKDTRPFPVGYQQFPITWLPARDGVPNGGIKRSASAPNCSYFTNWTQTSDYMTWDVDVTTAGNYEATVFYTCSKEDAGSTVELSFGSALIAAKVPAHDPPLWNKQDRVPRDAESYIKDFAPLSLGVVRLETGRGLLTLRAKEIAGKQVMDMFSVRLTLKP